MHPIKTLVCVCVLLLCTSCKKIENELIPLEKISHPWEDYSLAVFKMAPLEDEYGNKLNDNEVTISIFENKTINNLGSYHRLYYSQRISEVVGHNSYLVTTPKDYNTIANDYLTKTPKNYYLTVVVVDENGGLSNYDPDCWDGEKSLEETEIQILRCMIEDSYSYEPTYLFVEGYELSNWN